MDGYYTVREVLVPDQVKPSLSDHPLKFPLLWELADALHKILIGFLVVGDHLEKPTILTCHKGKPTQSAYLSQHGDNVEGVFIVYLPYERVGDVAEL